MNASRSSHVQSPETKLTLRIFLYSVLIANILLFITQLSWAQTTDSHNVLNTTPTSAPANNDSSAHQKRWPGILALAPSAPYIWDFSKPFNEYTWVAAHNAFLDDTTEQLERGVRALMWDVHPFRSGEAPDYKYDAYLCHMVPIIYDEKLACSERGITKKKFSTEIKNVIDFLEKPENKNAVVTLFLEDRIEQAFIQHAFDEVQNLKNYIFNINDYANTTQWPTLQNIIDSNKRIIILFEQKPGDYLFAGTTIQLPKDSHFLLQNTYDLKNPIVDDWSCESRWGESVPYTTKNVSHPGLTQWLRLFTMNQFHAFFSSKAHAGQVDNNLTWLEYRVDNACASANENIRMVPSYIALDFSQIGDAFQYASALSQGGVYFYENNNGTSEAHPNKSPESSSSKDVVCVLPTSLEWDIRLNSMGCENDEIRSLALRGIKKDTSIKLFDSPKESKSDDYTVIHVLRDIGLNERVVIDTLEESYKDADVDVTYNKHNGLDGKVSHITIEPVTGSTMPKIKFADDRGNAVCSVPIAGAASFEMGGNGDSYGCSNDDAQSLELTGGFAGTTVTLFGTKNANEHCSQGCVRLFIRKNMTAPFSINNLDDFGAKLESPDKSVLAVRYGGSQQLAGKVSYLTVSMGDFNSQDVVPTSSEADGSWGNWGEKAKCPIGMFAWGYSLKIEKSLSGDNTGLNSIKMFCSENAISNPIESATGQWGDWSETYSCSPANGPLKGFAMRTLWPRDHEDEVVATDILGICGDGTRIGGEMPEDWGSWSSDFMCPKDLNTVGFITRIEGYQGDGDDTAMNGMRMYCGRNFEIVLPVIQQLTADTSIIYWDNSHNQDGVAEFEITNSAGQTFKTHTNFTEFSTQGVSDLSVTTVDFDGNRSHPIKVSVPPYDGSPPAAPTGLKVVNLHDGLINISWDKTGAPADELTYEISINNEIKGKTNETSMSVQHSVPPSNFTFTVRAHKSNDTYSSPVSINIDRTRPLRPATVTFSTLAATSLTLSWSASTDDTKMKDYSIYKDDVLLAETPHTTLDINNLPLETNFTLSVKARDAADNYSEATSVFIDREAPSTPKDFKYSAVTDTSVALSWAPSSDNIGVTGYRITRNDNVVFDSSAPNFTDTALKPITTYRYEVQAYDANFNLSYAATLLIDRVPPSAPTNPIYSNDTGTTLLLKWTTSTDDIGVIGYTIYQDDKSDAIGSSDSTSFTVTHLTPVTTHSFHLEAYDAAGNKSERTSLLIDRVPPVLNPFFYAYNHDNNSPLLTWGDATDDIRVMGYELSMDGQLIYADSQHPVDTANLALDTNINHTFTLRAYDAGNNYSLPLELVLYHNRPTQPKDIKGTLLGIEGRGVVFDWFSGDPRTSKYSILTNSGIDKEQTETSVTTSFNQALSPPSVLIKVEAINDDGAKSLSVLCRKLSTVTAYPICEP